MAAGAKTCGSSCPRGGANDLGIADREISRGKEPAVCRSRVCASRARSIEDRHGRKVVAMGRPRRLVVIGIWKPDRIRVPLAIFERAPRRGIRNTGRGRAVGLRTRSHDELDDRRSGRRCGTSRHEENDASIPDEKAGHHPFGLLGELTNIGHLPKYRHFRLRHFLASPFTFIELSLEFRLQFRT